MRIIEVKELKSNTPILLILTGVLIVSGLNYSEKIVNYAAILASKLLGFSFLKAGLISSYIFEGLIILGLIYMIIKTLNNDNDSKTFSLIKFKHKHFKFILITFLGLLTISASISYLTKDFYSKGIHDYVEENYPIDKHLWYMELTNSFIWLIKGFLLIMLFVVIYFKKGKNAHTANNA